MILMERLLRNSQSLGFNVVKKKMKTINLKINNYKDGKHAHEIS